MSDRDSPAQPAAAPEARRPIADPAALVRAIRSWGTELGFARIGIADTELGEAQARLLGWLDAGHHGTMHYMERHGVLRARPAELVPGTVSVISARMDYLPEPREAIARALADPHSAFVSRYALGRDYHRVMRQRLKRLALRIAEAVGPFGWRVFADSAPVMEKPLAQKAGLGWIGKHTNLIDQGSGSWFFLGEIFTDLDLPRDAPARDRCGRCHACLDACPTGAILAPYRLDARLCISYLTIEHRGSIPEPLRPAIGNRIFGCDDCQLVCPWNRFARLASVPDLMPREGLATALLLELFAWDEATFLARTQGSTIRRLGASLWLRNIAVALGNAPPSRAARDALAARSDHPDPLVREHVAWARACQDQGGQGGDAAASPPRE